MVSFCGSFGDQRVVYIGLGVSAECTNLNGFGLIGLTGADEGGSNLEEVEVKEEKIKQDSDNALY